jgi:hypothetical protein
MPKDCIGWDSIVCTQVFFLPIWFRRERREALQYVAFVRLVLGSTLKSVVENSMHVDPSSGSSSTAGDEELVLVICDLEQQQLQVRATTHEKFKV